LNSECGVLIQKREDDILLMMLRNPATDARVKAEVAQA